MKQIRSLNANEILEMIFIYLTEISSLRDYDDIMDVLANMGRALTNSQRCTVWVVSDDRKKIWTKIAQGMDAIELDIDSGIVGSAIGNEQKIIIDDVYKDERFNPEIDKQTGYHTKSMMVIPMYDNNNTIIGAFQVINSKSKDGVYDVRDMQRLMLASTYAAETLISAKLSQEIDETQKEVIFTMGAIGESRSKETGNHVRRVAEYSKILALAYGLDESEAEMLKQVSPMHDIGKVAIADDILNKPGRFNPQERKIMNTHAELGYKMIKDSKRELLKAASIVAYQHHEKWDGSGYPRGLKGDEIHIYGRITAVADVFDALGSDRVYKKAWDDERILQFFRDERAKHFDPSLVDLFFENLDKIFEVRKKFQDRFKEDKPIPKKHTIKVLGAYGTKAKGFGASSFYLNKTNIVDAGNILDTLGEESTEIENIWITHAHLDHIVDIAYILDNYFMLRKKSLNVIGLPQTIQMIKKHYLNDIIWPDFSKIQLHNSTKMAVVYKELSIGKKYTIGKEETIRAFRTDHTIASCGYIYTKDKNSILIAADTYSLKNMIKQIDADKSIKSIVVECSFPSDMQILAETSKHLTPKLLFEMLDEVENKKLRLYINHIKPIFLEKIVQEVEQYKGDWSPRILKDGEILHFS